ncbi:MAG: agglutinin biogenesis protein MshI [Gammaproteobacteria bacterium]|nr:agglutinin biogenesis protein MshI [Gammaproteobacteria bacterium]MBU1624775.1 agglutinin biogenesis protein MshI [Gammaproteobacteria bacterium]MBU1982619.1 agglutinin biogenesis protein MshI [Gammaproteobacteria bacterium]
MELSKILSIFQRGSREAGWTAVTLGKKGVYVAQAKYVGPRPQVTRCTFFAANEVNSSTLERVRKEAQLENVRFTTLLLSNEYQMMMVEAPNVPVDELKTAIRWKIKDSLSYHVDDATIDVLQIPIGKYGSERPQSLYAVAASNETVRKRINLFEKAKIDLSVIDIPETAQRNIAALFETEGRGLALLSFNDEGGLLTISSDGELFLARRIEITVGQLSDADEMLRQQYQDRVELEVQRSLDYFDRQFHHISINRMLVSAPDELGLVALLGKNLGLPVEPLELAQGMDIVGVPEMADSEYASFALLAIGAALRLEKKAL